MKPLPLATDCCILCNEEGRLMGMPYNLDFLGISFVGTILFVGVAEDEFTDLDDQAAEFVLDCLRKK